jgi:large repetitive protein
VQLTVTVTGTSSGLPYSEPPADLTSTIDWGDGNVSAGTVTEGSSTSVTATHVYASAGLYTATVNVTDMSALPLPPTLGSTQLPVIIAGATVTLTAPSTLVRGQSLPLTATVAALAPATAPTGAVSFFLDGASSAAGSATLSGGTASFTYAPSAPLAPGQHTVTAKYGGDTNYGSVSSNALSFAVTQTPTTTRLTVPQTIVATAPATLVATVSGQDGPPTGTVTFTDGTTKLGTATLDGSGSATLAATLGAGAHSLAAQYAGDANFLASTSATVGATVGTPDFTVSTSPSSLTIARGATGTATITLTGTNGFSGNATLACGTLPPGVTCAFSPSTVTIGANAVTTTLTITNAQTATAARLGLVVPPLFALGGLLAVARRRRGHLVAAAVALVMLDACTHTSSQVIPSPASPAPSSSASPNPSPTPTTTALSVTVTAGGTSHVVSLNVTLL